MGDLAKAVFGQSKLPSRCLISAGAYIPSRANIVRKQFDRSERPRGNWIKFTNATEDNKEYLVCFNVYGAALMLELLHILKDGETSSIFFIGSMWARNLDVGTIVLPDSAIDRAGIVLLDKPGIKTVRVYPLCLRRVEGVLKAEKIQFVKGRIISVPSVLHELKKVRHLVDTSVEALGVELELSTFYYFGRKLGFKTYALVYVQDNPEHGIISGSETVWQARRRALRLVAKLALKVF